MTAVKQYTIAQPLTLPCGVTVRNRNQRDDHWGGDSERRMNFLRELYQAIRAEVGDDYPVGIKLNSADYPAT